MQTDDGYPDALPRGYHLHWYVLEQVLGQGGFGITYLARDTNLDQRVAIKEYLPVEVAARRNDASVRARTEEHDERYRWGLARFIREARTLARFDHPNIVRVLSVFEFNNTAYMVMRFEEGSNLATVLEKRGTLPETELMRIVRPILDDLELVHNAGFIHRDIEPDNIHIRADGSPVLLDFGSARQPVSHAPSMTILVAPGYAPFEQYYSSGENQGPWTDIYALGATCYRAVSGAAPLDAIARSKGVLGSARDMLVPASVVGTGRYSERLLKAVDHALEFEERKRPQSIADWRRELLPQAGAPRAEPAALSAAAPAAVPDLTPVTPARPGIRTFLLAGVAGGVVAIAGAALWLHINQGGSGGEGKTGVLSPAPVNHPKERPVIVDKAPSDVPNSADRALAAAGEPSKTTAQDEQLKLKAQIEKLQKQIDEQHQREVEAAQKQAEALKQEEARKQEAAKKAAVARQQKLAQQLSEARKRQAEEEQKKLAAEREAAKKASAQTQVATVEPVVTPPPLSPAQLLKKAESDYAAGRYADALPVFKQQAEGGHAEAQLDLGKAFAEGHGVKRDVASAALWYRKAAFQGHVEAQLRLGQLYADGQGVPRDDFQAYVWFSAAARGGNASAKARQEETAKLLQPVEIAQAGKLVASLPLPGAAK